MLIRTFTFAAIAASTLAGSVMSAQIGVNDDYRLRVSGKRRAGTSAESRRARGLS